MPTGTVATTVCVAVSIIDTSFDRRFATQTRFPSGVIAIPHEYAPTGIGLPTTWFVAVLITETLLAFVET